MGNVCFIEQFPWLGARVDSGHCKVVWVDMLLASPLSIVATEFHRLFLNV